MRLRVRVRAGVRVPLDEANEQVLAELPVPLVAREYYNSVGYYLSVGGKVPGFERALTLTRT